MGNLTSRVFSKIYKKLILKIKKISYSGPFEKWEDAIKKSKGYDDNKILKDVKKNTLISKKNLYYFERDGYLLKKNTIPNDQLHLVLNTINKKKRGLNIVDFGGFFGVNLF